MMSKLNLHDAVLIDKAKKISEKKGLSLSKVIENFLLEFTSKSEKENKSEKKDLEDKKNSLMDLKGVKVPADFDYKEERFKYLMEKYK